MTQGRAICRLISMFESIDDLVEEHDRRLSLESEEDEGIEAGNALPFTAG